MKTKVSTQRSFLSAVSRSVSTVGLIAAFAWSAAAQQWTGPNGSNNISNANSGNVGIGTAGPGSKLEINLAGTEGTGLNVLSGASNKYALIQWGRTSAEGTLAISRSAGAFFANSVPGDAWFGSTNGTIAFGDQTAGTASLIVRSGNIGIGTTSPGVAIDVVNSVAAGTGTARFKNTNANTQVIIDTAASQNANLRFDKNASPFWYLGNEASNDRFRFLNSNSNGNVEVFTILQGGNVGIGTGSPGAKLEVAGDGLIRVTEGNRIVPTSGVGLELSADTTGSYVGAYNRSTSAYRRLYFYGSPYVFEGGNVGIGRPDPEYKLDVVGDIRASGTIHAKYQDVAEWVPSSEQLSAGTVVVLDTTKSNQVISSGTAYDTRVAGVISAQPGITLGEGGEGKVLVATTGRVRVKVDASRGPIQIGDLLVTSDVSGVAMKSEPVEFAGRKMHMPGTIIGKALEPLAKGAGEILVLLSLQ